MAEKVIYEYNLPDGTILELEGEVGQEAKADAEAKRIIATEFTQQPTPQPELSPSQKLTDIARGAVTGASTGLIGAASLPSLVTQGTTALMERLGLPEVSYVNPMLPGLSRPPSFEQLQQAVETIPSAQAVTQFQPQTTLGEFAETIGEFSAPGGLLAQSRRALALGTGLGAIGGVVQEGQEQLGLTATQALPLTIATTLASGYFLGPTRTQKYAKDIMKGVSDEELALAKAVEAKANELKIPLSAPELIDNKILKGVGEIVYGTEQGGDIMYNFIKNRPNQINKVADDLLDEIIKNPDSVRQAYKKAGIAADKAIRSAETTRRIAAEDAGYIASNVAEISEGQVTFVLNQIDETIKNLPKKNPNIKKLENLKTRLTVDAQNNIPETNVNKLSSAIREFRDAAKDSKAGVADQRRFIDKEGRFALFNDDKTGILDNLDNQLRTNIDYKNAQDTFARLSNELVEPVLDNVGVLGKGVTPEKVKNFVFNAERSNVNDIRQTYKLLNKEDASAFPNIARAYVENAANKAFQIKPGGESLKSGFDLYKSLAGTQNQRRNFNAILEGVAEANGVNPNNLILGFDKFNEVLKRTARLANVDNPKIAPSTQNLPQTTAQIGSFMWRVKFASRYSEFLGQKTMKDLANLFTDERSVTLLEELAKVDVNSQIAVRRVVNIIALTSPQRDELPVQ